MHSPGVSIPAMIFLSKFLGLFTQPLGWVAMLLLWAFASHRRHPGRSRRMTGGALVMLLAIGWEPLPDMLLRALETQYPEIAPSADLQAYAGVVVLGGATESGRLTQAHRQPLMNDMGERMTATVAMFGGCQGSCRIKVVS